MGRYRINKRQKTLRGLTYIIVQCNETDKEYQITIPTSLASYFCSGIYPCFDQDCCGCIRSKFIYRNDY